MSNDQTKKKKHNTSRRQKKCDIYEVMNNSPPNEDKSICQIHTNFNDFR